ncbi:AI-2E family transporter [Paracoccus endophyticus]|uniref:AI-2E family transporter n=1 Tax=Paracoccus endophyticus TaxID=2233774 RepID=UPI001F0B8869|nr:AI-2E family transporter [Paracoccus endophyticus]
MGHPMQRRTIEGISFVSTMVLVTLAFMWLLLPYYGALLWAIILAILFYPLHRRLLRYSGGRQNLAAALSLAACICLAVIPGAILLASLVREASSLYARIGTPGFHLASGLQHFSDLLPDFVIDGLAFLGMDDLSELQRRVTSVLGQMMRGIAAQAVVIGQSTAQFVVGLGIMLYVLFFLFRDGPRIAAVIRRASPLSDSHTRRIFERFASAVKATVKGNLTIALVQGTIGGVTFWLLGIGAALLWGALMTFLSLLPAVGAALVWVPVAVYLLMTGAYGRGILLLAVGVLVISTIDNLLRPQLVGKDLRLPDYLILVSTVGGLALFGMNGFVIGPLIAALFVAVWLLFVDEQN